MVISGYTIAHRPVINNVANPDFRWAVRQPGATTIKDVVFTPPPIEVLIKVTPPPITQTVDGRPVTQEFPLIEQTVVVQPDSIVRQVEYQEPDRIVNPYESVGVIQTSPPRLCALIGPTTIALARHYGSAGSPPLTPGTIVTFYGPNGPTQSTLQTSSIAAYGDLELWRLGGNPNNIKPAAITNKPSFVNYTNKPVVVFGMVGDRSRAPYNWFAAEALGRILRATQGSNLVWSASCIFPDGTRLEPGDSGSPVFFTHENRIYYLGSIRKMASTFEVSMIHPWVFQLTPS